MTTAILVIWWIGLIGALALTLVILKEVFLVVSTLRDMLRLSQRILDASHGINRHVADAGALSGLQEALMPLGPAYQSLTIPLRSIATRLDQVRGAR